MVWNGLYQHGQGGIEIPTIKLQHSQLSDIQKFNGHVYDASRWVSDLSQIGVVVENSNDSEIEIEVFPDRPDLLSHENISRAARSFLENVDAPCEIDINHGPEKMLVDPSMEHVRPHVFAAIVRGVYTGDSDLAKDLFVQSLMDHQEKLHTTLGRKRKSVSIGVHDLGGVQGPFSVSADNGNSVFTPLGGEREMTLTEILEFHPKGVEYAHLIEPEKGYPLIRDCHGKVLSFPPIINGVDTKVTTESSDFLIDVTGWDRRACLAAIRLVALSLFERGGTVESVDVSQWDGSHWRLDFDPVEHKVPESLIKMILGIEVDSNTLEESISKMGGKIVGKVKVDQEAIGSKWDGTSGDDLAYLIQMPAWRGDLLHPVDIVEDIIIGMGLSSLPDKKSQVNLPGSPLIDSYTERRIRQSIRALGAHEVQTLTLTNDIREFQDVRTRPRGAITRIRNPITKEHGILRQNILPSLMEVLAANRHHELPHRIFELGATVIDHSNSTSVAWACADANAGFSTAKGFCMSLLRDLGANENNLTLVEGTPNEGPWLAGRVAKVMIGDIHIGTFGEVDPSVSHKFGLRVPIHAGEFYVNTIVDALPDPLFR